MDGGPVDFRALFEGSPDVLLVLLPDAPRFTMVAATEARLAATHTTREQVIGRGLFELFPDNPDDPAADGAANLRASLERVLATRAPDAMAVQKYDIRGPDGTFETKYWSPKNIPLLSAEGEVRYILHRVEEVTELVRASELGEELRDRTRAMEREVIARSRELSVANQELRRANHKLSELDATKTAFFNNVSHELRTPLTLLLGPIEDALVDGEHGLRGDALEQAHRNAVRLLRLINSLLDFARLEAGRLQSTFEATDLSVLTAGLAGSFHSLVESAGLRLIVDCPPLSRPVAVDRAHWEKIVLNLISNAFKFTFEGEIAVSLREVGEHIELAVRDTGTGIPDEELARVFERFHRVAGARGRSFEGTGIGLALVQEMVHLHGGTVRVESAVGRGSTFVVSIPRGEAPSPSPTAASSTVDAHGSSLVREAAQWLRTGVDLTGDGDVPQAHREDGRILLADDNPDMRTYLARLLGPRWSLDVVDDGQAALEAALAHPPDLVLTDVMMPRLDGVALLRALRADARTATVPVVLLTARASEESLVEGLDTGADDYLVKPFSARELLTRVRTHLAMSRLRRAAADAARELADTRAALLRDLERKNQELEAFSYSVSHDLRAPLRSIDGFSAALVEDCAAQLDANGQGWLRRIRAATQRMDELIDDLLKLSRVERATLTREPVDLSRLAAQVVEALRGASPERVVDVRITPDLVADVDARLLRIVLENLVGNAWKFTARSDGATVELGAVEEDGERRFFVRDNGVGFDPRYVGKLFAPFQRLHAESEFAGHGIGLATVQRIIERHGGRVWAEGAPGRGATIYWTIGAR